MQTLTSHHGLGSNDLFPDSGRRPETKGSNLLTEVFSPAEGLLSKPDEHTPEWPDVEGVSHAALAHWPLASWPFPLLWRTCWCLNLLRSKPSLRRCNVRISMRSEFHYRKKKATTEPTIQKYSALNLSISVTQYVNLTTSFIIHHIHIAYPFTQCLSYLR